MNMNENTILITGGGSGIGRALAEALHRQGNQVVITGRRAEPLDEVVAANPGMQSMILDVTDMESIKSKVVETIARFPSLNILINNAGIMQIENMVGGDYLATAEATISTNLLDPIRLTAALLPHLQQQSSSTIITVSSGLAFVPMAMTPTYSATKAAIHAYSMTMRHQLRNTSTKVIEIAPPYVQTELMGEHQANDPNAMPLADFTAEVMAILSSEPDVDEVIVERCEPLRSADQNKNMETMFQMINSFAH